MRSPQRGRNQEAHANQTGNPQQGIALLAAHFPASDMVLHFYYTAFDAPPSSEKGGPPPGAAYYAIC